MIKLKHILNERNNLKIIQNAMNLISSLGDSDLNDYPGGDIHNGKPYLQFNDKKQAKTAFKLLQKNRIKSKLEGDAINLVEGKLNEGPSHKFNAAYLDVKDAYYAIGDEIADIAPTIEALRNIPEGQEHLDDKLGKGGAQKEIQLFKQMERLFYKSKLGKIL